MRNKFTQHGYKLRFFTQVVAYFMTVGIITIRKMVWQVRPPYVGRISLSADNFWIGFKHKHNLIKMGVLHFLILTVNGHLKKGGVCGSYAPTNTPIPTS